MTLRVISADNHISEPKSLLESLPEHLRAMDRQKVERDGESYLDGPGLRPMRLAYTERYDGWVDDDERQREFRDDGSKGRDPDTRLAMQAKDGVYAEVIYPNTFMGVMNHPNDEFQRTASPIYNDYMIEQFGGRPDRFVPVAVLPSMNIDDAVAELHRVADLGFRTAMIAASVPWLPYSERDWDPLWSAFEETGLLCNFHVFTGNLCQFTEFADPLTIPLDRLEAYRERIRIRGFEEVLGTTVGGCVAAMSPLIHLTGSGALDRHPDLRFVLAECEAGWLPWTLAGMDRMQRRRHYGLNKLELQPSEYFRRQGYITISDDEIAMLLIDHIGADRVMWSNDYPHDEGTYPTSGEVIDRTMGHLDQATREQVLSGTAAAVYGFDKLWAAASV